jgi:hypothetical protein
MEKKEIVAWNCDGCRHLFTLWGQSICDKEWELILRPYLGCLQFILKEDEDPFP